VCRKHFVNVVPYTCYLGDRTMEICSARMGEIINVCKLLVGKREGKRPREMPRCK
jgi:hypothetical protein